MSQWAIQFTLRCDRYVALRPIGMFCEHRGRYALFRGRDAISGDPVHVWYYQDFAEDRIRVGPDLTDYGAVPRPLRTGPGDRPAAAPLPRRQDRQLNHGQHHGQHHA